MNRREFATALAVSLPTFGQTPPRARTRGIRRGITEVYEDETENFVIGVSFTPLSKTSITNLVVRVIPVSEQINYPQTPLSLLTQAGLIVPASEDVESQNGQKIIWGLRLGGMLKIRVQGDKAQAGGLIYRVGNFFGNPPGESVDSFRLARPAEIFITLGSGHPNGSAPPALLQ